MVGIPTPLHIAASLLAIAAATGVAAVLLEGGAVRPAQTRGAAGLARLLAAAGALTFAVGTALEAAFLVPATAGVAVAAGGLALLAVGLLPPSSAQLGPAVLVPVVPVEPAYAGAAAGVAAGLRLVVAGQGIAGVGVLGLGAALALRPGQPTAAAAVTVAASLLLGAWLWRASARRILAKLITAFVSALLALVILVASVLSTAGTVELIASELDRLRIVAAQLADDVRSWPNEALAAASAISAIPAQLVTPLSEDGAADLFAIGFRDQDFFLVLDAAGAPVNQHPPDLSGTLVLTLTGDPVVESVRSGAQAEGGGLVSSAGRIVAFGAVGLRLPDTRPEDPPVGTLITGRFVDALWVEREAAAVGLSLVAEIAAGGAVASDGVPVEPSDLLAALGPRDEGALSIGDEVIYAGSAALDDPSSGTPLGRVVVVSTPAAFAAAERAQVQRLLLVGLLGAVLAAAVAALVVRRFVSPIRTLTVAAERVGAGDLNTRAAVDSPDEVGRLGRAFDAMTASLAEQRQALADAASVQSRLRARLESLTRSMGDALIAVDDSGRIIAFNPAAEQLVGIPADAAFGQPLGPVLSGRLPDGRPLRTALEHPGGSVVIRALLDRPEGGWTPVALTASPVRDDDGRFLGRVFVLRDVSHEAELERMKTEFLANVSHELRTPLTPIKGYAGVLARRPVNPDAAQSFAVQILGATERLERVVELIVDFAALDSGRFELRLEPVDVRHVLDDVLAAARAATPERDFECDVDQPLPAVRADARMLHRALRELVDNAVKFSPGGEPITVTASLTDAGGTVRVDVVDRGVGLEQEAASRIFADFYQVDGTETRPFGGLGLGLALVRRIVEGLGARATVSSRPGAGSTFTLLLPVAGRPGPPPRPPPPPSPPGSWQVPPPPA